MDAQAALTIGQNALFILIGVSTPVLGTVLLVGLVISLFQALTQINEATLSFVPKLVAAVAVFAIAGPWMLVTLVDFLRRTLLSLPLYAI
jgi:flagellar biosynthetic protein FliQ